MGNDVTGSIALPGVATADDLARVERKLDELMGIVRALTLNSPTGLLDRRGAAAELGVSESTIDAAVKAGELVAVKIGTSVRITRDDVKAFIDSKREARQSA